MPNTKELIGFIKRPLIKKTSLVFVLILSAFLSIFILLWNNLPPQVPLYYSLPWGEKQLAAPWELAILPLSAISIFSINLFLSFIFFRENELLSKILVLTGLFVSIMLFYSLLQILILVS